MIPKVRRELQPLATPPPPIPLQPNVCEWWRDMNELRSLRDLYYVPKFRPQALCIHSRLMFNTDKNVNHNCRGS